MSKVSEDSAKAFIYNQNYKNNNTEVIVSDNGDVSMYLYGNHIAYKTSTYTKIANCGYFTKTTKDRLNRLPNVQITTHKKEWYLNGNIWRGEWIVV